MRNYVYVALCLLIPPIWGIVAARLFDTLARRQKKSAATAPAASTADDEWVYHI